VQAVEATEKLVQERPEWSPPHRYLGMWYGRLGLEKEALRAYQTYLGLERDPEKRREVEDRVEELRRAGR